MWLQWFPWRYILKRFARRQGFVDPVSLFSRLQQFAQPAEITVPLELLRSGAVLQARGLVNSQAIQHNLDWVWPYWVVQQFSPLNRSFIPRAFSFTHINLTHRNWTAVGIPGFDVTPIVDPRGLLMPFYDSWSIDAWLIYKDGRRIIPSHCDNVIQEFRAPFSVYTRAREGNSWLSSTVEVIKKSGSPQCMMNVESQADAPAWVVVSIRPYNPEGVSFIHRLEVNEGEDGFLINKKQQVFFSAPVEKYLFSQYRTGDVSHHLLTSQKEKSVQCNVGMATAAAFFELPSHSKHRFSARVPLAAGEPQASGRKYFFSDWEDKLFDDSRLHIDNQWYKFLYETALKTLLLHTSNTVYAGPFTYRLFWFRDAVYILHVMISLGFPQLAERVIDMFFRVQTGAGYFQSQRGEWDSNGQVLWLLQRFCALTGRQLKPFWKKGVIKAARWIQKKRLPLNSEPEHRGLMPSGFSAEHFGPNDYYYWDDFWSIAGLRAAARLLSSEKNKGAAEEFSSEADSFMQTVEENLAQVSKRLKSKAMPASPYRRMDSAAVGTLVAGYPLQIFSSNDERLSSTCEYLIKHCFIPVGNGLPDKKNMNFDKSVPESIRKQSRAIGVLFHDMTHSGINPYLNLHIAQVLLRNSDMRFFDIMRAIAHLASSTGQWPEAIHPHTKGGCMGDGQHVWAAAEWLYMVRNCFVREEEGINQLILCSGIQPDWYKDNPARFGPVLTSFGKISVSVRKQKNKVRVSWEPQFSEAAFRLLVSLPGYGPREVPAGATYYEYDMSAQD